jgi:hypothetical protein
LQPACNDLSILEKGTALNLSFILGHICARVDTHEMAAAAVAAAATGKGIEDEIKLLYFVNFPCIHAC